MLGGGVSFMSFNFWQTHAMGWRERQQTTQNSVYSKYFSGSEKVVMTLDFKNGKKVSLQVIIKICLSEF